MNAAISASVVLSSRLSDDISVFALMLFSVGLFGLFPVLRHRLQVTSHHVKIKGPYLFLIFYIKAAPAFLQPLLTITLSATSLLLTASLSTIVTFLFAAVLAFVMFVSPFVLVWAQRYKK
jgi:phosphatidylinositol glycan class C protein